MSIEFQEVSSAIVTILVFLVKVALNILLGYFAAVLIFAALVPDGGGRGSTVWRGLRDAYSPHSLWKTVRRTRHLANWKKEVGIWTFFTIGAGGLFDFDDFRFTLFFSALALTAMGALFIALQWKRAAEQKP